MACASNCTLSRAYTVAASSAAACNECSVATSLSAFSCTSTCPGFASSPDLNSTLRTRPASSVVMFTPCTARRLPTAVSSGCQSEELAMIVVTVCGGCGACAMNCLNL